MPQVCQRLNAAYRIGLATAFGLIAGFVACGDGQHVNKITAPTAENHPYFPIVVGDPHQNISCDECHGVGAASFKIVACTSCHTHDQVAEDDTHFSVFGYVYRSSACLGCHPEPGVQTP